MIISCGEALIDLVPDPVPGGGPMNVAVAAARLGVRAAFVGRVSTDDHGEAIWKHLEANEVDLSAAQRGPEPTALAVVEHDPDLTFRFEGNGTADSCLEPVDLSVLGGEPAIVHGGTLSLFRGPTADVLAELVADHDGVVSLDPNVRPAVIDDRPRWDRYHDHWIGHTDLYRGSVEDLRWIWPDRAPADVAGHLLDRGVGAVIVTDGDGGADIFCPDGHTQVPCTPVDVVDTVGAGDTFVATLLCCLDEAGLAGDPAGVRRLTVGDWSTHARRAVHAAAVTCSRRGADPPDRDEMGW